MSEVPRAALAAGGALVLVVVAGFFMSLMPGHLISRGWAAALGNTPLLAAVLLWQSVEDAPLIIAMGALALPGIAALRETFHEANESDFIQASFSLGRTRFGIWKSHVLPGTLPGLLNWTLRNAATALIMLSAVDFFSLKEGPAQSWGRMMRDGAGGILDDAPAVLVPALLVALWGLSFRLLSRAFETETPQPRT
jgi:ABC-type dipeptide/oligopeptide/nickel transport system permease subunit